MDAGLWSGLANIGAAAVVSIAVAIFEPRKNVRAVVVQNRAQQRTINLYSGDAY